jgi:hypothetical protein
MLIIKKDIHNFELMYEKYLNDGISYSTFCSWLNNNPHILMVDKFTDYSSAFSFTYELKKLIKYDIIGANTPLFRQVTGKWIYPLHFGYTRKEKWKWVPYIDLKNSYDIIKTIDQYEYTSRLLNDKKSHPEIHDLFNIDINLIDDYLHGEKDGYVVDFLNTIPQKILESIFYLKTELKFDEKMDEAIKTSFINYLPLLSFEEIHKKLSACLDNPFAETRTFISPLIWTDESLSRQDIYLKSTVAELITNIQKNNTELRDIGWKQLEEIVAEIFRNKGMQIFLNKNVPQGGRDIIGRIRLDTEYYNVAIEVKHRPHIDRQIFSTFLHQNRDFPLLYLVTSGTFSATVEKESKTAENIQRVKLFDGVAVRDLINGYNSD